jgi:hypothetical protein
MNPYRRGVRLSITIAPKASAAIDMLLATGLYGRSRAEVAQRFVYDRLREVEGPQQLLRPRPTGRVSRR